MPAISAHSRDADRPVAARAEEADLAGAVGDLRVGAVLGAQVDARRHEPEVAAAHEAQQAGEDQADDADPLDLVPDACTSTTTRRRPRTRRTGTPRRVRRSAIHSSSSVPTASRLGSERHGVACSPSATCRTGRSSSRTAPGRSTGAPAACSCPSAWPRGTGRTGRASPTRISKFICEWYVPHSSAQRPTYAPVLSIVTSNWLTTLPGNTSRLNSSAGTQNEWMTSCECSSNRIGLAGRHDQHRDVAAVTDRGDLLARRVDVLACLRR